MIRKVARLPIEAGPSKALAVLPIAVVLNSTAAPNGFAVTAPILVVFRVD